MEPQVAGEHLYDEFNRGRILALFRHPIDRVVSKFYYLQTATWERTYRPEWAELTIMEWAQKPSEDENFMVRKLVGKSFGDPVDLHDLIVAKELVRQRVVVGLMSEMEESFKRFNIVLGVDENEARNKKCMDEFFGKEEEEVRKDHENEGQATGEGETVVKKNSNAHPKVRNQVNQPFLNYFVESAFESSHTLCQLSMNQGRRGHTRMGDSCRKEFT